jgi:HSP20 family protein
MSLIRWNPVLGGSSRGITSIQDEVDRLFDGLLTRNGLQGDFRSTFTPAVDVEETANDFIVRADLPGLDQKDVKVNLMGDTLTIRGERRQEKERKGNVHRVERIYGSFERTFTFNTPVKNEGIQARYRDGVLEIVVPKADEAKVREIEVQVAS